MTEDERPPGRGNGAPPIPPPQLGELVFADIVCIALCGGILTAGGYVVGWATRNTQEAARVKHRLLPI